MPTFLTWPFCYANFHSESLAQLLPDFCLSQHGKNKTHYCEKCIVFLMTNFSIQQLQLLSSYSIYFGKQMTRKKTCLNHHNPHKLLSCNLLLNYQQSLTLKSVNYLFIFYKFNTVFGFPSCFIGYFTSIIKVKNL